MIEAVLYSDPACPWGYSANPALRAIEWRYGGQLDWSLVMIGLAEDPAQYESRGFTSLRAALAYVDFRRYGMPISPHPKQRMSATARACRAVVAARILQPGSEWRVFRELQLANFSSSLLLDDDDQLAEVLRSVPSVDATAIVSMLDDPGVTAAYEEDQAAAREAAGTAAELQGKTATSDGPVRYTAPSVVFRRGDTTLIAGGFQPVEAYDVLLANLDPSLRREPPPETPAPLLERFPGGLTTQEVAALMARGEDRPDRPAAERALIELVADGRVVRNPLGDDALWITATEVPTAKRVESAPSAEHP
jgi:predicted DsbA family dithiol-disulfide isomerase